MGERPPSREKPLQIDRRLASHFDWSLFALAMGLALLGILTIHSATIDITKEPSGLFVLRQLYWLLIGLGAMVVCFTVDYHSIDRLTPSPLDTLSALVCAQIGICRWNSDS